MSREFGAAVGSPDQASGGKVGRPLDRKSPAHSWAGLGRTAKPNLYYSDMV